MNLRHLDPAVWAAAFGAAFAKRHTIGDVEQAALDIETCAAFADHAVRALHPKADGPDEPTPWTTPPDAQRERLARRAFEVFAATSGRATWDRLGPERQATWRRVVEAILDLPPAADPIGERLARATVHPEAIRAPLPLPEAEEHGADCNGNILEFGGPFDCPGGGPDCPGAVSERQAREEDERRAKLPEAAPIPRVPDPAPGLDLATPAGRLAHLEAAERAVLLAAGWTEREEGVWTDPMSSNPNAPPTTWTTQGAIGRQRVRDRDAAHRP